MNSKLRLYASVHRGLEANEQAPEELGKVKQHAAKGTSNDPLKSSFY